MEFSFDVEEFRRRMKKARHKCEKGGLRGLQDCVDEVARIASEITPIDKGILQRSYAKEIIKKDGEVVGKIEFAVKEAQSNGKHYNYAIKMHEGDYELGEKSKQRPGTSGWSGRTYQVGNKYLERPINGEEVTCLNHIAAEIRRELNR